MCSRCVLSELVRKKECLLTVAHPQLFVAKEAAGSQAKNNLCFSFKIMLYMSYIEGRHHEVLE